MNKILFVIAKNSKFKLSKIIFHNIFFAATIIEDSYNVSAAKTRAVPILVKIYPFFELYKPAKSGNTSKYVYIHF